MKVSVSLNPQSVEYVAERLSEMKAAGFEAVDFQLQKRHWKKHYERNNSN